MVQQQLFSSSNEHWMTPEELLEEIYKMGTIVLDPCSHPNSKVKALNVFIFPDKDGLKEDWHTFKGGLVWVNPPYGRKMLKWIMKCVVEYARGAEVILLVPARTETKAWHRFIFASATKICFLSGRLKFIDGRDPNKAVKNATFPSALVYWGSRGNTFETIFSKLGKVF